MPLSRRVAQYRQQPADCLAYYHELLVEAGDDGSGGAGGVRAGSGAKRFAGVEVVTLVTGAASCNFCSSWEDHSVHPI